MYVFVLGWGGVVRSCAHVFISYKFNSRSVTLRFKFTITTKLIKIAVSYLFEFELTCLFDQIKLS